MNRHQVYASLQVALATSGPLGALILKYSGMPQHEFELWVSAALFVVPPLAAGVWGWIERNHRNTIAAASQIEGTKVLVSPTAPPGAQAALRDDRLPYVVPDKGDIT